ncbi:hypothetical protein [Sandaracinus amylolyticus]|uniref:Uncharacterized protein n=1 Tax=Sandaracinus amylolyticus TaxID=927083 RepID=A0A0F6YGX5_9BACT|nr:hypothetical protein [Sandaracinus amylolyticus]AKF05195.1 hypothetical protein DB32_002344 [Sandaracinus amylolyticus]
MHKAPRGPALALASWLLLSALAHPAPLVAQSVEPYRPPPVVLEPKRALTITGVSVLLTGWIGAAGLGLVLGIGFADASCSGGGLCPEVVASASQLPIAGPIINVAHADAQDGWILTQMALLATQSIGAALWIVGLALPGPLDERVEVTPLASPGLVGLAVRGSF